MSLSTHAKPSFFSVLDLSRIVLSEVTQLSDSHSVELGYLSPLWNTNFQILFCHMIKRKAGEGLEA
jgi:hypothetical protein